MVSRTEYEDVTPKLFIETWQRSATVGEVSERLGMPRNLVHARATKYRTSGIKLKKMPRPGRGKLDVEGLNLHLEKINQEMGLTEPAPPARRDPNELRARPDVAQKIVQKVLQKLHKSKR